MTNTQTEKQKQSLDEEFEHERTAQEDRKARHMLIHNTITPRELQQPKQNPELKQTNKTGLKEKERFTTLRTKDSQETFSLVSSDKMVLLSSEIGRSSSGRGQKRSGEERGCKRFPFMEGVFDWYETNNGKGSKTIK